jgi:GLPGLI family protein
MKTKYICILLLISYIASAQENGGSKNKSYLKTVDTANIAVFYTYYHKRDSTVEGYYSEPFRLYVYKERSVFYSYDQYRRDSITAFGLMNNKNPYDIVEERAQYTPGEEWCVRKDMKAKRYTYTHPMAFYYITAHGDLITPKWEIYDDSIRVVAGYPCKLAWGTLYGRRWKAWFCPEIPVNDGPWFLWGLPGLVLLVGDSNRYFIFSCDGIEHYSPLMEIPSFSTAKKEKETDLEAILKLEALNYSNSQEYLKIVADDDGWGDYPSPSPYIPLIKTIK